jgi:hypothetical protein
LRTGFLPVLGEFCRNVEKGLETLEALKQWGDVAGQVTVSRIIGIPPGDDVLS